MIKQSFVQAALGLGCGALLALSSACGSATASRDDAGLYDAVRAIDGGTAIDAGPQIDASPAPDAILPDARPPTGSRAEVTGTAGRVSGSTYTLDFQVGHPHSQKPSTGGGRTVEGAAVVKP